MDKKYVNRLAWGVSSNPREVEPRERENKIINSNTIRTNLLFECPCPPSSVRKNSSTKVKMEWNWNRTKRNWENNYSLDYLESAAMYFYFYCMCPIPLINKLCGFPMAIIYLLRLPTEIDRKLLELEETESDPSLFSSTYVLFQLCKICLCSLRQPRSRIFFTVHQVKRTIKYRFWMVPKLNGIIQLAVRCLKLEFNSFQQRGCFWKTPAPSNLSITVLDMCGARREASQAVASVIFIFDVAVNRTKGEIFRLVSSVTNANGV